MSRMAKYVVKIFETWRAVGDDSRLGQSKGCMPAGRPSLPATPTSKAYHTHPHTIACQSRLCALLLLVPYGSQSDTPTGKPYQTHHGPVLPSRKASPDATDRSFRFQCHSEKNWTIKSLLKCQSGNDPPWETKWDKKFLNRFCQPGRQVGYWSTLTLTRFIWGDVICF